MFPFALVCRKPTPCLLPLRVCKRGLAERTTSSLCLPFYWDQVQVASIVIPLVRLRDEKEPGQQMRKAAAHCPGRWRGRVHIQRGFQGPLGRDCRAWRSSVAEGLRKIKFSFGTFWALFIKPNKPAVPDFDSDLFSLPAQECTNFCVYTTKWPCLPRVL